MELRRVLSARRVDWIAAAVILAWALPNVPWRLNLAGHSGTPARIVAYLLLGFAVALPMLWRRRSPVPVVGAEVVLLCVQLFLGKNVSASLAAIAVASYGIGAYSSRRRWVPPLAGLCLLAGLALAASGYQQRLAGLAIVLIGAVILAGDAASARRAEYSSALDAARLGERAELARELHDVLAHQLSAIAVQAGSARLSANAVDDQSPAARTMSTIEVLARDALTEVSQILGVLRHEPGERPPSLSPPPTLADVDGLIEAARRDGTPLDVTIEGNVTDVDPVVGLCAYRIIQESLTNVARHAQGAQTTLTISVTDSEVAVSIANRSPTDAHLAKSPSRGGRGIRGMRERAEILGGRFSAGPTVDGGFAVVVRHLQRGGGTNVRGDRDEFS